MGYLLGLLFGAGLWFCGQLFLIYTCYILPRKTRTLPPLIKPRHKVMSQEEIRRLRLADNDLKEESCMWVNIIFARLWSELRDTEAFATGILNLARSEMIDLKRDPMGVFLGSPSDFIISDYHLGESTPTVSDITVLSRASGSSERAAAAGATLEEEDAELTVMYSIKYVNGITLVMEVPTSLGLRLTVAVRIAELSGRMFMQFRKRPLSVFSFGFFEMPHMDLKVQALINGTELRPFSSLVRFHMLSMFRAKLVLPYMKTKWFLNGPEQPPYPWELKEGEDESVLYNWKPKTFIPEHLATGTKGPSSASSPDAPLAPSKVGIPVLQQQQQRSTSPTPSASSGSSRPSSPSHEDGTAEKKESFKGATGGAGDLISAAFEEARLDPAKGTSPSPPTSPTSLTSTNAANAEEPSAAAARAAAFAKVAPPSPPQHAVASASPEVAMALGEAASHARELEEQERRGRIRGTEFHHDPEEEKVAHPLLPQKRAPSPIEIPSRGAAGAGVAGLEESLRNRAAVSQSL